MGFYDAIRVGASGAADSAFTVDRSLRFDHNDGQILSRTAGTSTSQYKFTFSTWVKLGRTIEATTNYGELFNGYAGSNNDNGFGAIYFYAGQLRFAGWSTTYRATNRLFRDPNAWYHIVVAVDSSLSTGDNRQKIYINGVEETSFATSNNLGQNNTFGIGNNSTVMQIGRDNSASSDRRFDGYMAEINYIDGQQLTPSSFGETDATTGQWNPKDTGSLTFGTNGFTLNFSDNSSTTATTMGKDTSGNGNNFTPNNFGGTNVDAVKDTPTNNFCTFNPLDSNSGINFSKGNLVVNTPQGFDVAKSTFFLSSGKWYWEVTCDDTGAGFIGVSDQDDVDIRGGGNATSCTIRTANGNKRISGSNSSYGSAVADGDVMMFAVDMDNGKFWAGKNGTFFNSGDPAAGSNAATSALTNPVSPSVSLYDNEDYTVNFGQDGTFAGNKTAQGNTDGGGIGNFFYAVPSGFKAICSANLSDPTILLPNNHFDTLLYSGTGSSQNITGLEYQPDWVWIKKRNGSENHELQDAVRGATKRLASNATTAESTVAGSISAFNSNGFTVVDAGTTNENGNTYVAWNWNAGDTDGKTYTVTVVDDSGNKYRFDGYGTSAVTLDLAEGGTYIFNYPSAHPLKFSTTADGTHGGGSEYTTGVTHNSSTQVTIVVAASAPTLYYYCSIHSGMGGAINTNTTLGSSNFAGTGQSTAKVNASAGFSIVSYTGNSTGSGVTQTIGHGLGVTPQVIIIKSRTWSSGDANWVVYHHKITNPNLNYLKLNQSNTTTTGDTAFMNQTLPTSTLFSLGYNYTTNKSSETYIAYCFSEVAGYSKFGSYTGNGSSDGMFVFTGFRPAFILLKATNSARNWVLMDNKRSAVSGANQNDYALEANNANTENTAGAVGSMDMLANGFKFKGSAADSNGSGNNYIYLAFAESPFKNARAR